MIHTDTSKRLLGLMMSIQELNNTDISKYRCNFVPTTGEPLRKVAVVFQKRQLNLIKQHHQDRGKTHKNKLEYRASKLKI